MQAKKQEIESATRDAFNRDGVLTEEEQKTLDWLNKDTETQIQHLEELQKEKDDIIKKAYEEKRNLTKEEENRLLEIKKEANKLDLDNSAKTQEDLLYMKNKFINEMGKLDLKGQSEMLKEKKAQSDKEIADIKARWDTKIELAKQKAKQLSGKEKEEAEQAIKVMEETRNKELENAKKHYNDLLEAVKEKYPQIAKEIEETSGKILTNDEKNHIEQLNKHTEHLQGMEQVTKTGWYEIYDSTSKTNKDIYFTVDETTGKVTSLYDYSTNTIKGKSKEQEKALESLKNSTEANMLKMTYQLQHLASSGQKNFKVYEDVVKQAGGTIEDLGENADGTRTKLVKLGNEQIEIHVDKNGAVRNLDEVKHKSDKLNRKIKMTIDVSVGGVGLGAAERLLRGHASGTNYLRGYASGVNYLPSFANGGMVRTRVNEIGWELFDLPRGTAGRMLGTHRGDDIMDLPTGTKITNHIASTRLMIEAVKKEVKRQMQPVYRGIDNISRGRQEKVIKQEVTVHFDNVVIRDDRDIKNIMQEMKYELNKEVY